MRPVAGHSFRYDGTAKLAKLVALAYQTVHYARVSRLKAIAIMALDGVKASSSISIPSLNTSSKAKKRILVVSADDAERSQICELLSQHGFGASPAADVAQVDDLLSSHAVDLVVVDLNVGTQPGLQLVERLGLDFPVVIMNKEPVAEADKVRGFECGAEDYISKPFGKREFVARLRVCLRPLPAAERTLPLRTFSFAGWSLNTRSRILRSGSGKETKLSAAEFNVLLAFLDHPQTVLSREEIIAKTRLHDREVVDRSIDVLILRLRRKIEADSSDAAIIKTVRGKGYVFVAPVRA